MKSVLITVGSGISDDIQKLVDFFDLECERFLDFDKIIQDNGSSTREYLDNLIKNESEWEKMSEWEKIAIACRLMIICDRELDLKKGTHLIDNTTEIFKGLQNSYNDHPYEAIRYANSCGLISYRRGDYSNALKYFGQAKVIASDSKPMNCFIPDTTSNIIRSNYDLFIYTLTQKQIACEEVEYYKKRFLDFIREYEIALNESPKYQTDDEKLKIFFAHGMASLYHNLGVVYSDTEKRKVFEDQFTNLKEIAKEKHNQSLLWGEKVGDIYRQLQSKNQLCAYNVEKSGDYEIDLLRGKWIRGRQFVLQRKIRNSKNSDEINDMINGDLKIGENNLKVKEGLILDEKHEDKIVVLHNYDSIKTCINNCKGGILDKEGNPITLLDITDAKIRVAKNLKDEISFFLYRRQAINLIRDDVYYKINQLWKDGNYEECISFSEDYNCRGLIELSQIALLKNFTERYNDQRKKIENLKNPIYKQICEKLAKNALRINNLSLDLEVENQESILNLLLAYEDLLGEYSEALHIDNQSVYTNLIDKLKEIPLEQDTAVIRFLTMKEEKEKIRAFLITRDGIIKLWKEEDLDLNIEMLVKGINYFANHLESKEMRQKNPEEQQDAYNNLFLVMAEFSERLKLYECLNGIKNLFIIPDGKLFQLPLHLLGKKGRDLRTDMHIKIYYCPSLYHLVTSLTGNNTSHNNTSYEDCNYLWVYCPTSDLYARREGGSESKLSRLNITGHSKKSILLEYDKATFESFINAFGDNKFNHIGFSTHGIFRDDSKNAYISPVLLSNSFLTPYDVLFSLNLNGVQTIFIGACQVGSSKYTDENEAVGLVTAFLAKNATSVIAPLWSIHYDTHNLFIDVLNKNSNFNSPKPLDMMDLITQCEEPYRLIPYVQYANIGIVHVSSKINFDPHC